MTARFTVISLCVKPKCIRFNQTTRSKKALNLPGHDQPRREFALIDDKFVDNIIFRHYWNAGQMWTCLSLRWTPQLWWRRPTTDTRTSWRCYWSRARTYTLLTYNRARHSDTRLVVRIRFMASILQKYPFGTLAFFFPESSFSLPLLTLGKFQFHFSPEHNFVIPVSSSLSFYEVHEHGIRNLANSGVKVSLHINAMKGRNDFLTKKGRHLHQSKTTTAKNSSPLK